MVIINSNRLKALKKENDELKTFVQNMSDKQKTISSLDEVIKKIRTELSNLQKQQLSYTDSIKKLKESEKTALSEVEKLNKELNNLRELKTEEQKHFTILSDQIPELEEINGKGNNKSHDKFYSAYYSGEKIRFKDAERKKNELQRETKELENKLRDLYGQIVDLTDQEQKLVNSIDTKNKQLDAIESYRLIDAKAELDDIENKIENVKRIEKKSTEEFQHRIKLLSQQEKELQNKVALRISELERTDEKLVGKTSQIQKDSNEKKPGFISQDQKSIDPIKLKKDELIKSNPEISPSDTSLQKEIQAVISNLKKEASQLKEHVNQLKMTEELKKELIGKLKDELSAKEIEVAALENDIKTKSDQCKEVSIKNQELAEEIEFKYNKLAKLNSSIDEKKAHFDRLEKTAAELDKGILELNNDITQREKIKTETENKILSGKEALNVLEKKQNTVRQNILILEAKRNELQENNKLFEHRFVKLFEKYSKDINEMNKKRNVLENILRKKEEDIHEKDDTLEEKIALLDETEKVLVLRQKDVDSFDDLIKLIKDQKAFLQGDLQNLNAKAAEKKLENQELKAESDVLRGKISEFEKSLLNLLNNADERLKKGTEKREKLDNEIKEYEIRLKELNNDIKDSMSELVDLQGAIGKIKVEHEEHRLEINKLASLKNKLYDEISKSRIILDKYKKIRERIRSERESVTRQREEKFKKDSTAHLTPTANRSIPDLTKMFKL